MDGASREDLLHALERVTERLDQLEKRLEHLERLQAGETPPPSLTEEARPRPRLPEWITPPPPPPHPAEAPAPEPPQTPKPPEEPDEAVGEPAPPVQEPLGSGSFLTEEEASGLPNPLVEAVGEPPARRSGSVEVDFATVWLPRIGGVLLLIGAALGAMYVQPMLNPLGRVLTGYLIAAGVGVLGWLARRRSLVYAQAAWAISLSLGYFVSFAAYFIPPMRVFPVFLPSLILMAGFAGTLITLADRWRSQPLAAFGFLLGVLAALVSAGSSELYALLALVVLAIAAAVLLLRREWLGLTALALVGTYLAHALLWVLLPLGGEPAAILAHLAALALYHVVFALAFHRWGRVWLARERALEESEELAAVPRRDVALLPLSSAFPMINSLALAALSLVLLYRTQSWWDHVHILLFALAAGELIRLPLRNTVRADLWQYHLLAGMALFTAGVVGALGGMERSGVLAAQTLILAIAGSRARSLRFLRPLSIIPALLSFNMLGSLGWLTPVEVLAGLATSTMVLASALPWERILNRGREWEKGRVVRWGEIVSGQVRGLIGAILVAAILVDEFAPGNTQPFLLLAACVMVLGIVVLRARAWAGGALLLSAVAAPGHVFFLQWDVPRFLVGGVLTLCLFRLWQQTSHNLAVRILLAITAGFLALGIYARVPEYTELRGIALLAMAAVCLATGRAGWHLRLPIVVPGGVEEEAPREQRRWLWTPLLILSALLLLGATVFAVCWDAMQELLSPTLVAVAWLGIWFFLRGKTPAFAVAYAALPFLVYTALLVHGGGAVWAALVMLPVCAGLCALAWRLKHPLDSWLVFLFPSVLPLHFVTVLFEEGMQTAGWPLMIIGGCVVLLALPALYRWLERRDGVFPVHQTGTVPVAEAHAYWMVTACGAVLLANWVLGGQLADRLITAAWGVTGIAILVAGFLLVERPMRHGALVILALTAGRIFLVDLAHADTLARILAFLVTGVVFILSGMAYVFLRNRAR